MNMKTFVTNDIVVIKLAGRFDAYQAPQLEKCFQAVYSGELTSSTTPKIVVDMTLVNFIDSTGLTTFVKAMKQCHEKEGDIVLCNLLKPVRIILELTRLDKVLTIVDTQEDALAQFTYVYELRSNHVA